MALTIRMANRYVSQKVPYSGGKGSGNHRHIASEVLHPRHDISDISFGTGAIEPPSMLNDDDSIIRVLNFRTIEKIRHLDKLVG